MTIQRYQSVKLLQYGASVLTETAIDLKSVTLCMEDGYGDTRGNYPATRVFGPFGELLLNTSFHEFLQEWRAAQGE